jgi:hypothetical protein
MIGSISIKSEVVRKSSSQGKAPPGVCFFSGFLAGQGKIFFLSEGRQLFSVRR